MSERGFHEDLSGHSAVKGSSDRVFGLVFALGFVLIAASPVARGGSIRVWPLPVATLFAIAAATAPALLAPLNRAWTALGLLLGKVVNPAVMGVIFFLLFTPIAVVMRLFGRDPLRLKTSPSTATLWRERQWERVDRESFRRQF